MPAEPATEPHADPSGPRWVRADTTSILVILAVALAARFIFLYEAQACPLSGFVIMDGKSYSAWADRIVAGDLLGSEVFYQAPLYPYLLALLKLLVGSSLLAIKSVQMVLGALSCVLLFLAGRLLFSRAVATAAGLGLALYAPAIFFDSLIQKAGLTTLLTCFLLYLLARAGARPSVVRFAALGGAVALLTLTREETILLLPALAAWALWRFAPSLTLRPRLIRIAALLLGAGLTLLPVALRNALVGGQFALTTSQAGPNFYIGNNPAATGTYAPLRPDRSNTTFERMDAFELAEQAEGRPLTPREVSRFWFGRALDFITSDPKAYAALLVRKAGLLVASHEIPDSEDQYFFERYSPFLRTISPVSHFGLLLPLAAAGVVLTLRRFRSLSGLHIVIVTVGVAVMLFYVFGRYRFPLVPPLMLFAAAALPALTLNWRTAQRRLALAGLAALVAFAILSNHDGQRREEGLAAAYTNAGAALADAGQDALAIPLLQTSLGLEATPKTRANLAFSMFRTGKTSEAIAHLRLAINQRKGDARLHFALGTALAETGDLSGSLSNLSEAVRLAPQDFDARVNHFNVLLALGMWGPGIAAMDDAIARFPREILLQSTLAYTLATCPDATARNPSRAVALAEACAAATAGQNPEILDILAASYAAAGRHAEAVSTATRGIAAARALKVEDLAQELERRRDLYQSGKALHEAAPGPASAPAPPPR